MLCDAVSGKSVSCRPDREFLDSLSVVISDTIGIGACEMFSGTVGSVSSPSDVVSDAEMSGPPATALAGSASESSSGGVAAESSAPPAVADLVPEVVEPEDPLDPEDEFDDSDEDDSDEDDSDELEDESESFGAAKAAPIPPVPTNPTTPRENAKAPTRDACFDEFTYAP